MLTRGVESGDLAHGAATLEPRHGGGRLVIEEPRVSRPVLGRVLLATGDYALRLGTRGILVRLGYVVNEAPDHGSAMRCLSENGGFDALVLGADLPPGGGLALLAATAEPPPTLLLTSPWTAPRPEDLARYPSISAVVMKPFPLSYLLSAFHYTLARGPRWIEGETPLS
jgi:DNA-binding response OmpR family regulator